MINSKIENANHGNNSIILINALSNWKFSTFKCFQRWNFCIFLENGIFWLGFILNQNDSSTAFFNLNSRSSSILQAPQFDKQSPTENNNFIYNIGYYDGYLYPYQHKITFEIYSILFLISYFSASLWTRENMWEMLLSFMGKVVNYWEII